MNSKLPNIYVHGDTLQARELKQFLLEKNMPYVETEGTVQEIARCTRAFLFVESLAEAERALEPLQEFLHMKKVIIFTNSTLNSVCSQMTVDMVVLTKQTQKDIGDWLTLLDHVS